MDVILAGVMLGVGLAVMLSLASRTVAMQAEGQKQVVAAWLMDEMLSMVLVEGPVIYPQLYPTHGRFDPPFDDYEYELDIEDIGLREPMRVTATVRWAHGRGLRQVSAQTYIAERQEEQRPLAASGCIDDTQGYRLLRPPCQRPPRSIFGRRSGCQTKPGGPTRRRGFTLVELMVAGVMAAFVLGAVSLCLAQLSDAKTGSRMSLEAHLRADAALAALQRNIVSILRDEDLFYTRLLLYDGSTNTPLGRMDRDEILVFNTQLRAIRDLDFMGDGMEFETQFRVESDALGPALWQRRDAVPDEYPRGGGVATPLVAGVVSLSIEVYDGDLWYDDWDSDYDGLPLAVRVTVVASGHSDEHDVWEAPLATVRTVIAIDRVLPPREEAPPELPTEDDLPDETGEAPAALDGTGAPGTTGGRQGGGRGVGGRGGGGGGQGTPAPRGRRPDPRDRVSPRLGGGGQR
jgi:uncharacterized membrane protein YgcG